MRKVFTRTVLPVLLCGVTSCVRLGPVVWVEGQRTFRIPAGEIRSVTVKTHNGPIDVAGEPEIDTAVVVADIRARGADTTDAQDCLDDLDLIAEVREGVLVVSWKHRNRRPGWGVRVAFDIVQPARASLEATTHNGSVTIRDLDAPVVVETHNGHVKLEQCVGACRAGTRNGSISLHGSPTDLDLSTHNGEILADVNTSGDVSGVIVTHNGNVEVTFAPGASTQVSCGTSSGAIRASSRFVDTSRTRRSFHGRLGDGGGELEITTHNGGIRLEDSPTF